MGKKGTGSSKTPGLNLHRDVATPISDADKQDAIQGYVRYSRVLDTDGLKEFYEDLDFLDLCNVRDLISDMDLTEQEQQLVNQADDRLRESFNGQTLQLYADSQPTLPVRDWWG